MTTLTHSTLHRSRPKIGVPPLHNGDYLTQPEFHRRYQATGENVKAELIEGLRTLNKGVKSPEHAAFVKRLKRAARH